MNHNEKKYAGSSIKLSYLLIGGGIGAVLALLFAPKAGTEFRTDIADATRAGLNKANETAGQIAEQAQSTYQTAKEKVGGVYETASHAVSAAANSVSETLSETAKSVKELPAKVQDAAEETSNQISNAVEAGKKEYNREKAFSANVAKNN